MTPCFPRLLLSFVCCVGLMVLMAGCGSANGPERAAVSGTVTFNGDPIQTGSIQFVPVEGVVGKPVSAPISNGEFSLSSGEGPAVGMNKVVINATRKTGKQKKNIMGEMEDEIEDFIPARYNAQTELQVEISSDSNTETFELTAQ
ncbi:hypothetical protein [Rubinisphaera brasiliensis]|uniref:hypothetical protein n=1 Tax=Rubinisphaera brasiliensis TaxID=119 RepID=UPI000301F8E0|nr:hypothetical protein [Rubinisphaera brasiliensis]